MSAYNIPAISLEYFWNRNSSSVLRIFWKNCFVVTRLCQKFNIWAWCKSGTKTLEPWGPGPPLKFKGGTRDTLKFKSRTLGPTPQSLEVEPQDPLESLKVGSPSGTSPFVNEFFFFKIFYLFSLICFFSSFLNNKHNIRPYLFSQAHFFYYHVPYW